MKYVVTKVPDIEEVFVKELRTYFLDGVRVQNVFKNIKSVRVSPIHPFAYLIDQQVNGARVPTDLFPSITVISDTDVKPESFFATVEEAELDQEELQHMISNREMYVISNEDLSAIQNMLQTKGIKGIGVSTFRSATVSFEVWADNVLLKNRIVDLTEAFLIGPARTELWNKANVLIHEESIQGNRSGNYNFDFGKMLFGGVITCRADYTFEQYLFDTEIADIKGVIHTYKEIANG